MTSTAPQTERERRRSMLGVPVDEQLRLYPNKVPVLTFGQAAKALAVIAADRKRNRTPHCPFCGEAWTGALPCGHCGEPDIPDAD